MMQCCYMVRPFPRGCLQHPHRRLPHLLFLLFLYSLTSCSSGITAPTKKESSVPLLAAIPDTAFRCLGHSAGYYADPETGCQVYHMCDTLERQYSYLCPNYTLFNQKFMVCDHWYMVNCSSSHDFYHLNSHIGEEPDKNEGEEKQNVIKAGPEDDTSRRRSKGAPTRTPPLGPELLTEGIGSARPSRPLPALKHSATQPVKAAVFKTPTEPFTPSSTSKIITSTIKPSMSSHTQLANPHPNPTTSKQHSTTKPQQSFTPSSRQSATTTRRPFTPPTKQRTTPTRRPFTHPTKRPTTTTRRPFTHPTKRPTDPTRRPFTHPPKRPTTPTRRPFTPTKQPTDPTRRLFTPPTTQPTITARRPFTQRTRKLTNSTNKPTNSTNKPTTSNRGLTTPTTRKPFTFSIPRPVTQSTRPFFNTLNTKVIATPSDVQQPPSSLITLPRIILSHHSSDESKRNNEENNVVHSDAHIPTMNISLSFTSKLTPPRAAHSHPGQERNLPGKAEQPSTALTMMPGTVARSPGHTFSFPYHKEEKSALTPEELQRIVFQPLLARPRTKTRRILTSVPTLLPIDPENFSDPHHHHFTMRVEFPDSVIPEDSSSRGALDFKLSNRHRTHTPNRLLQPLSVSANVDPLSSFFSLPTHPFTPITAMKQESLTPLTIPQRNHNIRTSPRDTFPPGVRRLPFPPSTRGNRDFFIPSAEFSLLVSNLPQNIVEVLDHDTSLSVNDQPQHPHHHNEHMTMMFPSPIGLSKMEELKLNPDCPRCHPEFLKPGQCHPCVVIK